VLPPIARKGTTVSIRKFMQGRPGIEKLIEWGSMTPEMAYLIRAMVHTKLNIVVSGGTGSGKTTLLNIVSTQIPNDERILTIEDSAELMLQQDHIVPFESRPADKFGKGEVNMGHLLHSALRLRPDRIVVGEVRGGEAFDLMQAMNTGHGGSMATTHANTPTDTLRRLESLCLMASVEMPMVAFPPRSPAPSTHHLLDASHGSRRTTAIARCSPRRQGRVPHPGALCTCPPTRTTPADPPHHSPTASSHLPRAHAGPRFATSPRSSSPATYCLPPPSAALRREARHKVDPLAQHASTASPTGHMKEMMPPRASSPRGRSAAQGEGQAGSYQGTYDYSSGDGTHDQARPPPPASPPSRPGPRHAPAAAAAPPAPGSRGPGPPRCHAPANGPRPAWT
jgi:pilus assembly protein CpaF